MTYMVKLYRWKSGWHPSDEEEIYLHFNPQRETLRGQSWWDRVVQIWREL